ncbi:MAG: MarR family winged helix-turn-helix transcriptional regulator [Rhodococcus sp. (in: high G+C Gram-positive bacteria)]|uniref:MarR family winged helix-turn-helix transcriptional regulator n=1 Tax=Rhodococcus sp. TaxID=1831 RepID=UPI003BAE4A57
MRVVDGRSIRQYCGTEQNVDESHAPARGVVAVHDELVSLVRQLVAEDHPPTDDLTFAQHSLLSFIARNPGCRAIQISDAFGVNRSTVSRQLRRCIDEEWVHAEPGPLRSGHPLSLTARGAAILAGADARCVEGVRDRVSSWSDSEIEEFALHLRRFRDRGDVHPGRGHDRYRTGVEHRA